MKAGISQKYRPFVAIIAILSTIVVMFGGCVPSSEETSSSGNQAAVIDNYTDDEPAGNNENIKPTGLMNAYDMQFQDVARIIDNVDGAVAETGRKDYFYLQSDPAFSFCFKPSGEVFEFEFALVSQTYNAGSPMLSYHIVTSNVDLKDGGPNLKHNAFLSDTVGIVGSIVRKSKPTWEVPGEPDLDGDGVSYCSLAEFNNWYRVLDLQSITEELITDTPVMFELSSKALDFKELEALGDNIVFLDCTAATPRQMSLEEVRQEAKTAPNSRGDGILHLNDKRYFVLLPYYSSEAVSGIREIAEKDESGNENTFVSNNVIVLCMPSN